MPNTDALAEAEWHICATEYRVLRAIRMRPSNDNDVDDAHVSGLFADLEAAIARLRALKAQATTGPAAEPPSPSSGKTIVAHATQ